MSLLTKRRLLFALFVAALTINLAVGFCVYSREAETSGETEAFEKIGVMMRVLHLLRKDYVNADKVNFNDLIYNALHGMVNSLDPFSDFMSPEEYEDMMETTEGQFGGLGVIVTVRDGILTVVSPIEDTPGSRAGLLAGDQILRIDGEATKELGLEDTVKRLKGPPGSKVTITVHRPSANKTWDVAIERALIPVVNVKDTKVLDKQIGYVRIVQFNEPTAAKLEEALDFLNAKQVGSLIVDLRNNPGGLLESAIDACSLFLPAKTLVVSTQGRQPSQKHEYLSTKAPKFTGKPVAILVNQGSASAAEIMAGCLQDWGVAVLVGEKTFGKGSVQNVIELPDGSALRLTTAMYYTPSKRVIHEHGIEPDIEVKLTEDELRRLAESESAPGEGAKGGEDRQFLRAVEILSSYEIYQKSRQTRGRELRKVSEKRDAEAKPPEAAKPEEKKP